MAIRAQIQGGDTLEFPDGTDPAVIDRTVQSHILHTQRLAAAQGGLKSELANDPTSGNGDLDIAGAGSALSDAGLSIRQMLAKAFDRKEWQAKLDQEAIDKRRTDAPLLNTTAGKVGQFVGEAAPAVLIPGGAEIEGVGALARLGLSAGKAALSGAGSAALQPVAGDESRLENMGTGALLGGALGGAGKALSSIGGANTAAQDAAIEAGEKLGLRASPAQRLGSPVLQKVEAGLESNPVTSMGMNALKSSNQRIINNVVSKAIGEDSDVIDSTVLRNAKDRIKGVFQKVADDNVRPVDPDAVQNALQGIEQDARGVTSTPIMSHPLVKDFFDEVADGTLTGKVAQDLSSKLNKAAKAQFTSATGDRSLGASLNQVKELVDDALQSTLSPAEQAEFKAARQQYRTLIQLKSPGVLNPSNGNVSGKSLANMLTKKDEYGFREGRTNSPMYDAARFAQAFPTIADSGTATRLGTIGTLGAAGGTAALAGLPATLAGAGAAAAAGRLYTTKAAAGLARTLGRYSPSSGQAIVPLSAALTQLLRDPSLLKDNVPMDNAAAVQRLRAGRPQPMTRDQIEALLSGGG